MGLQAPDGSAFQPGDRVAGPAPIGTWAEVALATPAVTFPIPEGMSYAQAPAPVNYQSASFGLVERGSATAAETVRVHGPAAGGGVVTNVPGGPPEARLAVTHLAGAAYR